MRRPWYHLSALAYAVAGIALILVGVRGCEGSHARARALVEAGGYTDVDVGGSDALECGGGGQSNRFSATGADGRRVFGVVCCPTFGCGRPCSIQFGH